jgi:calcineurin-like phosphoesterase family protein
MVYIAADTKFKLADRRDSDLIKNWNDTVNDDDLVILFG